MKCSLGISDFLEEISSLIHSMVFLFLCIDHWGRLSYLSLLFFGTLQKTSQSSRKSVLNIHWKDWCWNWNSNTLTTWYEELTHWKRPWCWERLKAGGEGDDRDESWIASLTWTWVWASAGSWWWTRKPGVLQSMGLQRIRHEWVTKLNWKY